MSKDLEKIGTPGIVVLADVSAHGSGLYLRLERRLWETYGILAGDRLEIRIQGHYRQRKQGEEPEA